MSQVSTNWTTLIAKHANDLRALAKRARGRHPLGSAAAIRAGGSRAPGRAESDSTPEADAYTVQLKKKAEETRQAERIEFDFSKYDLTVDGSTISHLTKRQDKVSKLQAKLGGKYNLRRYLCDDGELFHISGRTYALSNQWSVNTISIVDEVIAKLLPGSLSYAKEAT